MIVGLCFTTHPVDYLNDCATLRGHALTRVYTPLQIGAPEGRPLGAWVDHDMVAPGDHAGRAQ